MKSSKTKDIVSVATASAVAPAVIVLRELGDDQQRRDLGFHRHVARDKDH